MDFKEAVRAPYHGVCATVCFLIFAGKALYLEFPTNPTLEQLVSGSKDLLNKLTDFRNRIDLTNASELRQVREIYYFIPVFVY